MTVVRGNNVNGMGPNTPVGLLKAVAMSLIFLPHATEIEANGGLPEPGPEPLLGNFSNRTGSDNAKPEHTGDLAVVVPETPEEAPVIVNFPAG